MNLIFKQLFYQINPLLFPFVKKVLRGLSPEPQWTQDTEDVIQTAWEKLLSKYPQFMDDEIVARSIIFVIAKNEALQKRRQRQKIVFTGENSETFFKFQTKQPIYEELIKEDSQVILQMLPANYAFIWQKSLELEVFYEQVQVVKLIREEYLQNFGEILSLANYRQLKRRANLKIIALLSQEFV